MKLSELMEGRTPNPQYAGLVQADDFVLAVNLGSGTAAGDYLVAQEGITEHSGTLNPETTDSTYIRSGKKTTKTAVQRQFSVTGDIYAGDEFQDALLDYKVKFGTGQTVVKDYVYFNLLTGKGEKGLIDITVEDDPSGAAGENASFSATLYAKGAPQEYTYPEAP